MNERTVVEKLMIKGKLAVCCLFLAVCSLLNISPAAATPDAASEILQSHIRNNYPWPEVEIKDLILSEDMPDEEPQRVLVRKNPPGKSIFLLEFGNGRRITASANIKAFDWVVMSRRGFGKGYCLQRDDVYTSLMEVARIPKGAVKSPDRITGKTLTRSVIANMPFVDAMVSEFSQVKRGQKVLLQTDSPGFNISAMGELKENAYVGDYVKAVNQLSKRSVTGLLIDENTVKVDF